MANRRMLNCGICLNEKYGSLSPYARLLFIGMITTADDDGRLKGSVLYLKARVFPYDNYTTDQLTEWVNEIINLNMVIRYKVGDCDYLYLTGWFEHQTLRVDRRTPSVLPPPPDELLTTNGIPNDNQVATIGIPYDNQVRQNRNQAQPQYSIDKVSIDKVRLDKDKNTPSKKKYGEFQNVLLTDDEHKKLTDRFNSHLPELIETMSSGIESKGYKYKSHYAAILNWAKRDLGKGKNNGNNPTSNRQLPEKYQTVDEYRAEYRRTHGITS